MAYIDSPLGQSEEAIIAPRSGIVIGQQMLPLVNEGDAVFHLAYFAHANSIVEQQLETFIDDIGPIS